MNVIDRRSRVSKPRRTIRSAGRATPSPSQPPRLPGLLAFGLVTVILLVPTRGGGGGQEDRTRDPDAEAIEVLRQVFEAPAAAERRLVVERLRELGDPDLRPLFAAIADRGDALSGAVALRALAELESPPRLDPWRLRQVPDERTRLLGLAVGLEEGLFDDTALRSLAESDDFDPEVRIVLHHALAERRDEVDVEALRGLVEATEQPEARARGLVLLGRDPADVDAVLAPLPGRLARVVERRLLGVLRQQPVASASPWIASVLADPQLDAPVRFEAIAALLVTDRDAGLEAWRTAWAEREGLGHRLQYALLLLDVAESVPPEAFAPIASVAEPDTLLGDIAAAGRAVAAGRTGVAEASRLVDRHHRPSLWWVVERVRETDAGGDEMADLLVRLVEDTLEDGPEMEDRLDAARFAARRLGETAPDRLTALLAVARRRHRHLTEIAILSGAFAAGTAEALRAVEAEPDAPLSTRAESLLVMLRARARSAGSLDADDRARLVRIFRGGGDVPAGYEAVAAWLHLEQVGRGGPALASIIAGNG